MTKRTRLPRRQFPRGCWSRVTQAAMAGDPARAQFAGQLTTRRLPSKVGAATGIYCSGRGEHSSNPYFVPQGKALEQAYAPTACSTWKRGYGGRYAMTPRALFFTTRQANGVGSASSTRSCRPIWRVTSAHGRQCLFASYKTGQLKQYTAAIYIGSTYDEPLPTAFLDDVYGATTPVIWAYDNIWQLTAR